MRRSLGRLATLTMVVGLVAGSGVASAQTTESIAETGGMQLSLSLLGAPVDLGVTLDEFGAITEVVVSDDSFSPTSTTDTRVRFVNEDDSTRVEVRAKGKRLQASVKSASLDDLIGTHTWRADVFGTGAATTVTFDVATDGAGQPSIEHIVVEDLPAGATATIEESDVEVDDDGAEDRAKVEFAYDGYTKRLKIVVEVEDHDDGSGPTAKLKVELTGKDRRQIQGTLDDLLGAHTWDGLLCDGTTVAVSFTVTEAGALTLDAVTFDGAEAPDRYVAGELDNKIQIRFDDGKARVKIQLTSDEGEYRLKVDSKTTETCKTDDHGRDEVKDKKAKSDDGRDHDEDDDHDDDHHEDEHDDD